MKEVYLIHHTHMDIGFTDLAHEVLDQHLAHLDLVLDLCEGNAGLPEDRRHYWTCESAFLVRDYLACRSKARKDTLLRALRDGWIELQAFLTQPLTELASAEELIGCVGYAAELGRKHSFPVECATLDDIGGYAGRLPTVLSGWGIRCLVAGAGAFQVHLPWADLPHLFYLEGKDGSRTLLWNLGIDRSRSPRDMTELDAVYGMGGAYLVIPYSHKLTGKLPHGLEMDDSLSAACADPRGQFGRLIERLERENYPYEEVLLQYAMDNRGPDPNLAEVVARLNDRGELPRIRLTTPRHFFRRMEQKYGGRIPMIRGVIADPWIIRANPVPTLLKTYRAAQRSAGSAQARTAVWPGPDEAPAFEDVYRNAHLYADHTYGLNEWGWDEQFSPGRGCRDSAFDRYRASWATKRFHAESAMRHAAELDRAAGQRLSSNMRSPDRSILVWNTCPWDVHGPAELYLGRDAGELLSLTDAAAGSAVAFQHIGRNRYLILPPPVPAMGYRRLNPAFGDCPARAPDAPSGPVADMENAFLRLSFNNAGRLLSIVDKATGEDRLDRESGMGLGDFVYHTIEGVASVPLQAGMSREWRAAALPVHADRVRVGISGPVAESVVAEGHVDAPSGVVRVRHEVTLFAHAPRIDLLIRLDKPETERKEACYVAFPFAGRDGVFGYDQNLGWVSPAEDLIPGAMQDAFYCWSWLNLWEGRRGVTVACPDAPVLQLGGVRTGRWDDTFPFKTESNHAYAWLYHNILNTDDPIWQDVLDEFRFGIVFHSGEAFAPDIAASAAGEIGTPLRAELRPANPWGSIDEPAAAFLRVSPSSVRVLSLSQTAPGALRLRLEETSGQASQVRVWLWHPARRAWREDFFGRRQSDVLVEGRDLTLDLEPNALATIGVEYV